MRPRAIQLLARLDGGGAIEGLRQIQHERAAEPDFAGQPDLAAEQPRNLAADREAQARATILAARGAVGLLERLEDDAVLVRGDPDAGVSDTKRDHPSRAAQRDVIVAPAVAGDIDRQVDLALFREFQR